MIPGGRKQNSSNKTRKHELYGSSTVTEKKIKIKIFYSP